MSKKNLFKDLGVGVGLRSLFYKHFRDSAPASVDFVEVVTENYLPAFEFQSSRPFENLLKVRAHTPVVLHGVSLSIASTDPLDKNYLRALKELASQVQPEWISDHLCWTGVGEENLHDLLPVPYTQKAAKHISDRIKRVQDFLGRRILIENVSSYIEYQSSEMTEWEFVNEVIERADCGLLLDVNNIYVSGYNHGFDPRQYLKSIPRERVGQIHLAGHTVKDGYLIDTHSTPIAPEVWELYRFVVREMGLIATMVERDGNIPPWAELEKEVLQIAQIRETLKEKSEKRSQKKQFEITPDTVS